jgi:hypothetical protein
MRRARGRLTVPVLCRRLRHHRLGLHRVSTMTLEKSAGLAAPVRAAMFRLSCSSATAMSCLQPFARGIEPAGLMLSADPLLHHISALDGADIATGFRINPLSRTPPFGHSRLRCGLASVAAASNPYGVHHAGISRYLVLPRRLQGMPWSAGCHKNWGIFKCHEWGELLRHSHGHSSPRSDGKGRSSAFNSASVEGTSRSHAGQSSSPRVTGMRSAGRSARSRQW